MDRIAQASLIMSLLGSANYAQAEIEIMAGRSEAAVLGDGQGTGRFSPFPEQKVSGSTIILQGLLRPFPYKQLGLGLRWQNSYFQGFRTTDKLGNAAASDAIRLMLLSPVLALQFETISNLSLRFSLAYLSVADGVHVENAQSQSFKVSSGFHFGLGGAYRLNESNQVVFQYSYEAVDLKANGAVAGTRLKQINPSSYLLGLTFGA